MKLLATIALFGLLSSIQASNTATSKREFCQNNKSQFHHRDLLKTRDSRIAFRNQGGFFGGGTCWWHSRFTRNAAYLTIFRPELEKPSKEETYKIIHKIRLGKSVVTVPGYTDLLEFTYENEDLVQKQLNAWQRHDSLVNMGWLQGLLGSTKNSPKRFKKKMDKLYKSVVDGNVVFQVLQLKGVVAHAWLVVDMEKTPKGYDLVVVDSNYPRSTNFYRFEEGMKSFHYSGWGNFIPYTYKKSELKRIKRIGRKFCK